MGIVAACARQTAGIVVLATPVGSAHALAMCIENLSTSITRKVQTWAMHPKNHEALSEPYLRSSSTSVTPLVSGTHNCPSVRLHCCLIDHMLSDSACFVLYVTYFTHPFLFFRDDEVFVVELLVKTRGPNQDKGCESDVHTVGAFSMKSRMRFFVRHRAPTKPRSPCILRTLVGAHLA